MKHKTKLLLLSLLLLITLAACGGANQEDSAEIAAIDTADFGNIVSASGKVMPVRWADMSFETGGRILNVVEEGDQVDAGEILALVEASDLEQAVLQAVAELAAAEANLSLAKSGARSEDLTAAEGVKKQAEGRVAAAMGSLAQTENNSGAEVKSAAAGLAQAQANYETAVAELGRAQAELGRVQAGPREEEIAMYQARVNQAQSEFLISEQLHFENFIDKEIGGGGEERARYQRESDRNARIAAQAELDLVKAGSAGQEIAAAAAAVRAAQAQVDVAAAGVSAAEVVLEQAQASDAAVAIAQAEVQIAQGELQQAQAELDRLSNGKTAEEIAVLEADVARTKAALSQAEAALESTIIRAPFAGTIGNVRYHSGEVALPGAAVLALGDTSSLRIETTDLNEVDAAQITLDSPVTLSFDAFPGTTREGSIVRLAPMASAGQGGTNFTAIVEIGDPPADLRWGMTAFVDVEV